MSYMKPQMELEPITGQGGETDAGAVGRNFELIREAYRNTHNDIHTKEWAYHTANKKKWRHGSDPDGDNYLFQYLASGDWKVQSNWVTAFAITPTGIVVTFDLSDIPATRILPATMTVSTGTLTSGTVADVQAWSDGNEVHITEVAGVPGFDVEFTFTGVTDFARLGLAAYYAGSATHHAEYCVYDDANTAWRVLWTFSNGLGHNYRYSDLPVDDRSDYINSSGEVKTRLYHPTTGNAAHDLYINYAALIK